MNLSGAVAIVTGGAGHLGSAIVEALLAKGAAAAIFDRRADDLARGAQPVSDALSWHALDVADDAAVAQAVDAVVEKFGRLDILVNCAGMIRSAPLINTLADGAARRHDPAVWDAVIRANLTSTFTVSAHVADRMTATRTKGVIVNISSVAAAGNPAQSAYSAAKAGVDALTAAWAKELGLLGVRVVGVAPGFIDTPSTHEALGQSLVKEWTRRTPLRRLGTPEQVAAAVIFAVENDFVTGRTIAVDGGVAV